MSLLGTLLPKIAAPMQYFFQIIDQPTGQYSLSDRIAEFSVKTNNESLAKTHPCIPDIFKLSLYKEYICKWKKKHSNLGMHYCILISKASLFIPSCKQYTNKYIGRCPYLHHFAHDNINTYSYSHTCIEWQPCVLQRQTIDKCWLKVLQKVPTGAFCNTVDLH